MADDAHGLLRRGRCGLRLRPGRPGCGLPSVEFLEYCRGALAVVLEQVAADGPAKQRQPLRLAMEIVPYLFGDEESLARSGPADIPVPVAHDTDAAARGGLVVFRSNSPRTCQDVPAAPYAPGRESVAGRGDCRLVIGLRELRGVRGLYKPFLDVLAFHLVCGNDTRRVFWGTQNGAGAHP
ncbi:MAG: hypothetical protein AB7P49_11455 [Bdellovibrionales bacterium]